jgi:ELWxxDGT repeat protein
MIRFTFFLFFVPALLFGQAQLVVDTHIGNGEIFDKTFILLSSGKLAYGGSDPIHGEEPWISDGTAAGTRLLADIDTTGVGSNAQNFIEINGVVYYKAFADGKLGLYRTNLSTFVTELYVPMQAPTGVNYKVSPILSLANRLVFTTSFNENGLATLELWSLGTIATDLVKVPLGQGPTSIGHNSFPKKIGSKVYFNINSSNNELWETDGTAQNTRKLGEIPLPLRMRDYITDGSNFFTLSSVFIEPTFFLDTTLHVHRLTTSNQTLSFTDSMKLNTYQFPAPELLKNGKAWMANTGLLYSLDMATGKLQKLPNTGGFGSFDNQFVECNGKIYVYTTPPSTGKTTLFEFNPTTSALTKVLERATSVSTFEPPLCYGHTLVGEWNKSSTNSGGFLLYNGVDTIYFSSGQNSQEFRLSGSTLYWIGDGSDGIYGSLWKLDLATVALHEPLPQQLDVSVYPTLTTHGEFNLGGTDSHVQLMSAQLVNSAGRIVHVTTRPQVGEPLQFGYKAPGLYYVYLIDMQGRKTITKVVYH